MEAALRRGRDAAGPQDREAFDIVMPWAADPSPDTPLPRALAVRAATELAAAGARARERLRDAEDAVAEGGPGAAVAAATTAGAIAAELLDLDPEDFEPEIAAYVEAGRRPEDIAALARATGDPEIRAWARGAVAATDEPEAPAASAGVRHLASGPPPDDPAEDLVWVPDDPVPGRGGHRAGPGGRGRGGLRGRGGQRDHRPVRHGRGRGDHALAPSLAPGRDDRARRLGPDAPRRPTRRTRRAPSGQASAGPPTIVYASRVRRGPV